MLNKYTKNIFFGIVNAACQKNHINLIQTVGGDCAQTLDVTSGFLGRIIFSNC